jgi:hypothetical protein
MQACEVADDRFHEVMDGRFGCIVGSLDMTCKQPHVNLPSMPSTCFFGLISI